jgi:archaellum component FlaC|tara:strand:- start:659 stop:847 length:189 start_codon:yes stop_codon:yes gene_type:complete
MDAIHYDKIADKLVNFHSKLPQERDLQEKTAIEHIQNMKVMIGNILREIDVLASLDNQGWIR